MEFNFKTVIAYSVAGLSAAWAFSTAYAAYVSPYPVAASSWTTLSSVQWNRMVTALQSLDTALSNFSFSSGNVGIGTASPYTSLVVRSAQPSSSQHPYRSGITAEGEWSTVWARVSVRYSWAEDSPIFLSYRTRWTLSSPTAVTAWDYLASFLWFGYDGSGWQSWGNWWMNVLSTESHSTTSHGTALQFLTTTNSTAALTEKMRLDHNGNLWIGTSAPEAQIHATDGGYFSRIAIGRAYPWYSATNPYETIGLNPAHNLRFNFWSTEQYIMEASGWARAKWGWTTYSDARLKKNVETLRHPLETVEKLRWVSYDWKSGAGHTVGVIAQETEEVLPEAVITGSDGYKSVDYGKFAPVLIEAVKELKASSDKKDSEIAELRSRLEKLEK